jgi:hypothetical protein
MQLWRGGGGGGGGGGVSVKLFEACEVLTVLTQKQIKYFVSECFCLVVQTNTLQIICCNFFFHLNTEPETVCAICF